MTPSPPSWRHERKYVLRGRSLSETLALIHRHPALFREPFPPRFVNNLYFDTPGLQDYFDHVHGLAHRVKHRVRWYGRLDGHIARPVFEQKLKHGLVSAKVSAGLPAFAFNGGGARHVHEALIQAGETPPAPRLALRQLQPSLVNRYHRHYFVSRDGQIRLTVDSDLRFFPVAGQPVSTAGLALPDAPLVIELKYDPSSADRAAAVSNALPFRVSRCSKYVLGIESLHC